ncbi:hypothetical protein JCM10212_005075 [Sporobolomyces blumeae]
MPPDRSSSTTYAAQQAANRDKAASIARGLACQSCRKAKVKCDSGRPACSRCVKVAKGSDSGLVACLYDDLTAPKKKRSSPGTVAALEASNSALQQELDDLKAYIARHKVGSTDGPPTPSSSSSPAEYGVVPICGTMPVPDPAGSSYAAVAEIHHAPQIDAPESPMADLWTQLIYPGWPKDLPSFELTSRLLEVWFHKPHCLSGMINPERFRAAMLHPPTTSIFPHAALIHAMMAIASMLVSEDFFANEPRYWPLNQKVTEYHAARAKVALDQAIAHGQRLLQVSQAVTILCYWAYTQARFVEVWLYCGMATRIITPLGLNQLACPADTKSPKMHLLAPPKDDAELYERSMNCWLAFTSDRMASACTGWAHSIEEADMLTLLPTFGPSSLAGDLDTSPLSVSSPSFLLAHPPHLVGPRELEMKAIVLLGRVNTFAYRSGLVTSRGSNTLRSAGTEIRNTDAFRRLESDIIGFQASIPREYQASSGAIITDPRLHMVHSIPPATMLLLHERFVTMDENDVSMPVCLRAAQQVMQALHRITGTSFEIGLLSPFITYTWTVAGRSLVREIALRTVRNRPEGIDQLRADVMLIIRALESCKTPLGLSTSTGLDELLKDPLRALPKGGQSPTGCPYGAVAPPPANQTPMYTTILSSMDLSTLEQDPTTYLSAGDFSSKASSATASGTPGWKPFSPPLSSSTSFSSPLESGKDAQGGASPSMFQEIDDTLKQGFFNGLGDQSFGPELDALIRGSRASAPWNQQQTSAEPTAPVQPSYPASMSTGIAMPGETATLGMSANDAPMGLPRFEEIDGNDLARMESIASHLGGGAVA